MADRQPDDEPPRTPPRPGRGLPCCVALHELWCGSIPVLGALARRVQELQPEADDFAALRRALPLRCDCLQHNGGCVIPPEILQRELTPELYRRLVALQAIRARTVLRRAESAALVALCRLPPSRLSSSSSSSSLLSLSTSSPSSSSSWFGIPTSLAELLDRSRSLASRLLMPMRDSSSSSSSTDTPPSEHDLDPNDPDCTLTTAEQSEQNQEQLANEQQQQQQPSAFEALPPELVQLIFSFLLPVPIEHGPLDRAAYMHLLLLGQVCRRWWLLVEQLLDQARMRAHQLLEARCGPDGMHQLFHNPQFDVAEETFRDELYSSPSPLGVPIVLQGIIGSYELSIWSPFLAKWLPQSDGFEKHDADPPLYLPVEGQEEILNVNGYSWLALYWDSEHLLRRLSQPHGLSIFIGSPWREEIGSQHHARMFAIRVPHGLSSEQLSSLSLEHMATMVADVFSTKVRSLPELHHAHHDDDLWFTPTATLGTPHYAGQRSYDWSPLASVPAAVRCITSHYVNFTWNGWGDCHAIDMVRIYCLLVSTLTLGSATDALSGARYLFHSKRFAFHASMGGVPVAPWGTGGHFVTDFCFAAVDSQCVSFLLLGGYALVCTFK